MNILDWGLIVLFALGALWGYKSGLITGALTVIGLYVAGLVSSQFSERVISLIGKTVEGESLSTALAYVVIYVGIFLVARILAKMIKSLLGIVLLGWVDKVGGIALGLLAGFLIIGAVVGGAGRYVYVAPETELTGDAMEQFAKGMAREGLKGVIMISLEESIVTSAVVDVYNVLPGGALGMLPGDFAKAYEILDERIKLE